MTSTEHAATSAVDLALTILHESVAGERVYKTDRDYATETDYRIEDRLRDHLRDVTPDVGFLGEERGHTGNINRYWCLDPIDGTTNYTRGIPNYGVALALIDGDQPVIGEIALPAHRERYTIRGGVAVLNDRAVRVAGTSDLAEAIVAVGDFATGPGSPEKNRHRLTTMTRLADRVGRVRMLGSAATDLAWLAAGRVDAVVMHANNAWDMGAGVALARSAGATITDHDGRRYTLASQSLLAAAPDVHAALLSMVGGGGQ